MFSRQEKTYRGVRTKRGTDDGSWSVDLTSGSGVSQPDPGTHNVFSSLRFFTLPYTSSRGLPNPVLPGTVFGSESKSRRGTVKSLRRLPKTNPQVGGPVRWLVG